MVGDSGEGAGLVDLIGRGVLRKDGEGAVVAKSGSGSRGGGEGVTGGVAGGGVAHSSERARTWGE